MVALQFTQMLVTLRSMIPFIGGGRDWDAMDAMGSARRQQKQISHLQAAKRQEREKRPFAKDDVYVAIYQ